MIISIHEATQASTKTEVDIIKADTISIHEATQASTGWSIQNACFLGFQSTRLRKPRQSTSPDLMPVG